MDDKDKDKDIHRYINELVSVMDWYNLYGDDRTEAMKEHYFNKIRSLCHPDTTIDDNIINSLDVELSVSFLECLNATADKQDKTKNPYDYSEEYLRILYNDMSDPEILQRYTIVTISSIFSVNTSNEVKIAMSECLANKMSVIYKGMTFEAFSSWAKMQDGPDKSWIFDRPIKGCIRELGLIPKDGE